MEGVTHKLWRVAPGIVAVLLATLVVMHVCGVLALRQAQGRLRDAQNALNDPTRKVAAEQAELSKDIQDLQNVSTGSLSIGWRQKAQQEAPQLMQKAQHRQLELQNAPPGYYPKRTGGDPMDGEIRNWVRDYSPGGRFGGPKTAP